MGQEFDSVTVPINSIFTYNKDGDLVVNTLCNISNPVQMLYEMVSRARNELNIVVIDDLDLFIKLNEIKNETQSMFFQAIHDLTINNN